MVGNLVNGGSVFEGRIDEVAVWLRALDAAGIAALGASPVEWPPRLSAAVADAGLGPDAAPAHLAAALARALLRPRW